MSGRLVPCLGAVALLAGCAVGPTFTRPLVPAPPLWGPERADVPSRTVQTDIDAQWWTSFGDPELTSLVDRLVEQNLDLRTAAERILQGQAQRDAVASQGLPHVDEQSSYTRMRESPNGLIELVEPSPGAPLEFDLWQNGLSSSWELDLFGRVRRAVEAAHAETLASVENRRGIALSALAQLAGDYVELRGTQAREDITRRNLDLSAREVGIVRTQLQNGVATTLQLAQSQAQQAGIAATLPALQAQEDRLINAIGLLLGEPPRALQAELASPSAQPGVPPVVPVGLPGQLVRRRPDVREAEARLHAATAETGVAIADFYPDVSLSGAASLQSLQLSDAFSIASRAFQFGPSISIPIFEGGRLRATLTLRRSQQREAAIAFQRTVLQAWQEVDDALTAYTQAQRRQMQVAEVARQDAIALAAARQQYLQGTADFLNVISAQAGLLQSQSDLADSRTAIASDLVTLYQSLGGGWSVAEGRP